MVRFSSTHQKNVVIVSFEIIDDLIKYFDKKFCDDFNLRKKSYQLCDPNLCTAYIVTDLFLEPNFYPTNQDLWS